MVEDRGTSPDHPGFPGTVWASAPGLIDSEAFASEVGQYVSALPDLAEVAATDNQVVPGPLTLVIDQLDEHPDLDQFVRHFGAALEGKDTRSLNVLIACRAAEYPKSLTVILERSFGSCTVAELAPLTRDQAVAVAAQDVSDPDVFLEAMCRSGAGALVTSPLTLRMLVSDWRAGTEGGGPALSIFDRNARRLLSFPHETGIELSESSLEERMAIASRIAAYLLLSGRRTLRLGSSAWANSEEITPGRLASGREAAGLGEFDVTPVKVRETLATNMFAPGSESTEFTHSSVAAFLAAKYLIARFRSLGSPALERQLSGVFLVSAPDEPTAQIPEHLRETAAWISGLAPRQAEWLAAADPQSLAGYSMWIPDSEIRSVLVDGLLNRAERIELAGGAEWPRARWDLNHPALAARLSDTLGSAAEDTEYEWADLARVRVAVRIALDSRVEGAMSALLRLVESPGWPVSVRQRAARAAMNCSPDGAVRRLRGLLRHLVVTQLSAHALSDDDEFDDLSGDSELVGTLLSLLWPEHLSFDEAVLHIRVRRQPMGIGVYRGEAERFAREVRDVDLDRFIVHANTAVRAFVAAPDGPQALDSTDPDPVRRVPLLGISAEDEWGLREFIAPVLDRVFASGRVYELLEAVAEMIAPLMRASFRIPMPARLELVDRNGVELSATADLRRRLAHELVLLLTAAELPFDRYCAHLVVSEWCQEQVFAQSPIRTPVEAERRERQRLLDDSDSAWCLSQIDTFRESVDPVLVQAYALIVSIIADPYNPDTFAQLENRPDSPEREHFRWVFDGMPIDDDYARTMRRQTAARFSWDGAEEFVSVQRQRLVAAASGDCDAFWTLVYRLWVNPSTGRFEDARSLDVSSSPGVSIWAAAEFSSCFRTATISYLQSAHDHRETWLGLEKTDRRAEAGVIGLAFLYRTEGTAGLRSVPPTVWASWTAAILAGRPGLSDQNPDLYTELVGFVTQHALSSVAECVNEWVRTNLTNATSPWLFVQTVPLLPRQVHSHMVTLACSLLDWVCPSEEHSDSFAAGPNSEGDGGVVGQAGDLSAVLSIWSVLLRPSLKLHDERAVQHVRSVFSDARESDTGRAEEIAITSAALLLATDTQRQWSLVHAAIVESADFARDLAYACTEHQVADALMRDLCDSDIVSCYRWLARVHSPTTEVHHLGFSEVTPVQEVHSMRRAVLAEATRRGTAAVVYGLRDLLESDPNSLELHAALVNARAMVQRKATVNLSTSNIQDLLADHRRRIIGSSAQLAAVVTEILIDIEKDIHTHGFLLWDRERDRDENGERISLFRPKPEGSFGVYITHELKLRLADRPVVVNREVVVQPTGPGDSGLRPDILVGAISHQSSEIAATMTVPIEIKGIWHKDVLTAQQGQLLPYLRMTNSSSGVYLVAWYPLDQWTTAKDNVSRNKTKAHGSAPQLLATLQAQAAEIRRNTGLSITPYVLTVSTTTPSALLEMYDSDPDEFD
ncbi:hypothetical protein ACFVJ5_30645 [Nocardia sp. NPDC127606]|uniref:hypothetical protein n=1 Tax=Nocardia sp. NPDC127606 TaxID=3345406 RepID=UPI003628C8BF